MTQSSLLFGALTAALALACSSNDAPTSQAVAGTAGVGVVAGASGSAGNAVAGSASGGAGGGVLGGAAGSGGQGGTGSDCTAASTSLLCQPLGAMPASIKATGLFPAMPDFSQHSAQMLEYVPDPPLWSDGMKKQRFLVLPTGTQIDNSDPKRWQFPVGTLFIKTFFDDSGAGGASRPIETRLIRATTMAPSCAGGSRRAGAGPGGCPCPCWFASSRLTPPTSTAYPTAAEWQWDWLPTSWSSTPIRRS